MANLKKNISYNFIYQLLILILPLITAPYLSRILGANGIGVFSYAYSVAIYFTYITMLGLNNYGNRAIASVQDNLITRSKVFWSIYASQLLCFCISIIFYCLYIRFLAKDKMASILMIFFVISSALDINWFFFGMEKFKLTVIRNSIIKIASVIVIFIFVKNEGDVYKYILIMSLSYLISQISIWPFLKKYVQIVKISINDIKQHMIPNLMLFIPVIAVSIYKIMDKIMLGGMTSTSELGYYENAEKIINVPIALITAVGTVMLPRMTSLLSRKKYEESKKYIDLTMTIVLAFSNIICFGIIALGEEFSLIYYGGEFLKTGVIMQFLAITIIFLGAGNVIRTQYLIPYKMDKVYIESAIWGAIVNLIFNVMLIGKLGAIGAAIGTICAELSVCVYQMYFSRKSLRLINYIKQEVIFLLISIIMYKTINMLPEFENVYKSLAIHICVGVLVYGFMCGCYLRKKLIKR